MRAEAAELRLLALPGIPPVRAGDDLAALLAAAARRAGEAFFDGDVVVVAQKIVSKAEGRIVPLAGVAPSPRARELAARTGKDPRAVEVILGETAEVRRAVPGVLIVETRHGLVLANAGADASNVEQGSPHEDDRLLLLPEDPDASAARLRAALEERAAQEGGGGGGGGVGGGARIGLGVVVADSVGRAWREGTVGLAIGVSGLPARLDRRGEPDLFGRKLHVTEVGIADSIASAASLLMGEGAEGRPAVVVRGLPFAGPGTAAAAARDGRARDLVRPRKSDLFR